MNVYKLFYSSWQRTRISIIYISRNFIYTTHILAPLSLLLLHSSYYHNITSVIFINSLFCHFVAAPADNQNRYPDLLSYPIPDSCLIIYNQLRISRDKQCLHSITPIIPINAFWQCSTPNTNCLNFDGTG
jgi:hypothetical protein